MKRFVTLLLAVTAVLALTSPARADAISALQLGETAGGKAITLLLLLAVVLYTIVLLRKFRKKK